MPRTNTCIHCKQVFVLDDNQRKDTAHRCIECAQALKDAYEAHSKREQQTQERNERIMAEVRKEEENTIYLPFNCTKEDLRWLIKEGYLSL